MVPEIDVPGHCYAPLVAVPALRDPHETGTYRSVQGFPNNALNPAVAETWRFLEAVFGEVAAIFPGQWRSHCLTVSTEKVTLLLSQCNL
ncbi:hypothetical protein BH10PSE9_BH10PSE9_13930 [soil metagenome]